MTLASRTPYLAIRRISPEPLERKQICAGLELAQPGDMLQKTLTVLMGMAVAAMIGCGGNVDSGSGGGGAGGGTGGSTTTTTTTKKDPQSLCTALCEAGDKAGCLAGSTPAQCISECTGDFANFPECSDQFTALAECGAGSVETAGCDLSMVCGAEAQAAIACQGNSCGDGTCSGSNNTCSCTSTCNGVGRQVDCDSSSGTIKCTCTEDSAVVGMCDGTDLSCNVDAMGCCAQFWSN